MLERLDIFIAFATVLLGISLLITILNQMISSLLGYRATYLRDGLKDLLETLDPDLRSDVPAIVDKVLTHKLASDSAFVHQKWAPQRWKLATTIRPEELTKLLSLVAQGQPYEANIKKILSQVNPTLARETELIGSLVPGAATADQLIKELSSSTTKAIGRLEASFNSTMDRIRQRFTLQMRVWTIVFAVIFAFVYHLDAMRIYSQLATDPVLRATVSGISNDLIKTYTDVTAPSASNAATGGQQPATGQAPAANHLSPEQAKEVLDRRTKDLSKAYSDVRDELGNSNLVLFEVPQPWYKWDPSEIFGILAMAGFLSLGAPFWYNVLTKLVNLRSQVAQKQKDEAAQEATN
jgi:hypothetical protein